MNIAEWLFRTAQMYPGRPALLRGEELIADYAAFAARAQALGDWLGSDYGIEAGDRVGIFMKNRTEYLEALYAIWWRGAVAVPINAKLHAREAAWILEDAEAKAVFVGEQEVGLLDGDGLAIALAPASISVDGAFSDTVPATVMMPPHRREADDLAWLFYTSGTTGRPKGVMISHGNLIAMSLCYPLDVDEVCADDAALYAAPMSHGAGLYNFIHVRLGARHVVPLSGGFDADEVLDLAKAINNVSMFAAPTVVQRLVAQARARGEDGDGIKTIVYGGGPMYLADMQTALGQMGQRFVQIYGQGESPMTITALSRDNHANTEHPQYDQRLASVGRAQSAVEVRIADQEGRALPTGEVGEVEVKGATVMLGYWRQPEATRDAIKDGWLRTGDMGMLDEDGFLTLRDRSKDVVISGGTNIYPREVEEALLTHPDVAEVSVIGLPDAEWGEIVVACVVPVDGHDVDEGALDRHCLASIARFKRPKRYIQLSQLPKNNYGKVLKSELRASMNNLPGEKEDT